MLSWIATRIFYAVVFFVLGAWMASESPHFRALMHRTSHIGALSFDKMRDWTSDTLLKTPTFNDVGSTQSSTASSAPPPSGDAAPQPPAATAPEAQAADAPQAAAPAAAQAPATTPARATTSAPAATQASTASAPEAGAAADSLVQARQAYARKDFSAAIDAYRAYIAQSPDAIGARGELGDVYFAAGRKQDAAQMYFECATKNIDAGNIAAAKALVGAVRAGDPAMADDLERRVAAASNKKS
jgi:thioredoxin-like negative regulator of GroEL